MSSTVETTITNASRPRRNRAHLILRYFPPDLNGVKIMNRTHARLHPRAALFSALMALILATTGVAAAASGSDRAPIVHIDTGVVRGVIMPLGYAFLGVPYAAPPTGNLRWQPPQSPAAWQGIRDATGFAASCPQPMDFTLGPRDEDCLFLNIY